MSSVKKKARKKSDSKTEHVPRPRVSVLAAALVIVCGTVAIAWQSNETAPARSAEGGDVKTLTLSDLGGSAIAEPNGLEISTASAAGERADMNAHEDRPLSESQKNWLTTVNWEAWVGSGKGIWISVDEQVLRLIDANTIQLEFPCATAAKGTGSQLHSNKTPLGWHTISEKIGQNDPWGRVFRERKATSEIWKPGQDAKSDMVLSRILWLSGQEPGKNMGGTVDSHGRFIYIHGTNGEGLIGTPSSHGCVRLKNDDVIQLFEHVDVNTPVVITERPKQ